MDETCCTAEQMAVIGITSEQIAYAFGWGFAAVTLLWGFRFAIEAAIKIIRKA